MTFGLKVDKSGAAGDERLDVVFELIGFALGIEECSLGL
jgi:hypothetical protein